MTGRFSMSAPAGAHCCVVRLDLKTQEIPVSANVRVVLQSDSKLLEECCCCIW